MTAHPIYDNTVSRDCNSKSKSKQQAEGSSTVATKRSSRQECATVKQYIGARKRRLFVRRRDVTREDATNAFTTSADGHSARRVIETRSRLVLVIVIIDHSLNGPHVDLCTCVCTKSQRTNVSLYTHTHGIRVHADLPCE